MSNLSEMREQLEGGGQGVWGERLRLGWKMLMGALLLFGFAEGIFNLIHLKKVLD